jgi:N-ethylmaleimide reductase
LAQLFDPLQLDDMVLPNRFVMAPMTRSRASVDGIASPSAAIYYAQRASAGLLISEGAQVSETARGYLFTPGIHSDPQIAAWHTVTDAVHAAGGRIFAQLWHCGRVSHPFFHEGELPGGPSALPVDGITFTDEGPQPVPTPRELSLAEISGLIAQFAAAAAAARQAGFDGVEIHGANGYLLDQFLRDGANRRSDGYGGSVANRARLALEVVEAISATWAPERISYRVSPHFAMYSMADSDPQATFSYLATALAGKVGLLHVVEPVAGPAEVARAARMLPWLKQQFAGPVIANGGYDKSSAEAVITAGHADLVSFGSSFIANPDLPARMAAGHPLATPVEATIYGGGDDGYIDYPALWQA